VAEQQRRASAAEALPEPLLRALPELHVSFRLLEAALQAVEERAVQLLDAAC